MATLIKNLRNDRKVIFDSGRFDQWCVYVVEFDESRSAPRDSTYFTELQRMAKKYPANKVYDDFVSIYEQTTNKIDERVLIFIDEIVDTYEKDDQPIIEQWFSVIYGGMIAEEKKEGAILKKKIKRLGMHQVLMLGMTPSDAANFSRGKKVSELIPLIKCYGF